MPLTFAGPLIRSAIATMQAGMPARVAAFNADVANEVDLTAPATYHFGASDLLSSFAFPQVEVAIVEGRLGSWSLGQHAADHSPRATIGVWTECMSGHVPTAYEESLGLASCVLELLCAQGAFGQIAVIDDVEQVYWRTDIIPADLTSTERVIEKWRVPTFITIPLATVEQFA